MNLKGTRRRGIVVAALCVAATLVVPAAAFGTLTISDGTGAGEVLILSDDEGDFVDITNRTSQHDFLIYADEGSAVPCMTPMKLPGSYDCDYPGVSALTFLTGGGADIMSVNDQTAWPRRIELTAKGEAGRDVLAGGAGDDILRGGPGRDQLLGKKGFDKLNARDGQRDLLIDCGAGDDPRPKIDPMDPNPRHC